MKRTKGQKIYEVFNYIIITALVFVALYPFWHVVMSAFSDSSKLMAHEGLILKPVDFSLKSIKMVLKD